MYKDAKAQYNTEVIEDYIIYADPDNFKSKSKTLIKVK